MWYFSWVLGLLLAASFAIMNGMWYEIMDDQANQREQGARKPDEPHSPP